MTATRITNLKKSGVYGDTDGLRLRVTKTGKKNWIFRYRLFGKNKDMGLGSFPDISLSLARKKRDQQKELILQNIDPILENKKISRHKEPANPVIFLRKVDDFTFCSLSHSHSRCFLTSSFVRLFTPFFFSETIP